MPPTPSVLAEIFSPKRSVPASQGDWESMEPENTQL